jgi:acyl carrier protein
MQATVEAARARFGAIHGGIHSAGVPAGGIMQLKTPEAAASIFAPKVRGAFILDSLLGGEQLDFFLLFSSLTATLGGVGQVDYCAANAFLDSFAKYNTSANDTFTVSINWDAWQEVGMAANAIAPLGFGIIDVEGDLASREIDRIDAESIINRRSQRLHLDGILPNQGRDLFFRVLSGNVSPQIAVSTKDINGLIRETSGFTQKRILEEMRIYQQSAFPRPNVQTPFVAPRNQTESAIAETWQQLLGVSEIGIHDDFFELGGHSLLALQLISRMRESFSVEMKMRTIFDAPTVAGLSEMVEQLLEEGKMSQEPALVSISRDAYRIKVDSHQGIDLPRAMRKKN